MLLAFQFCLHVPSNLHVSHSLRELAHLFGEFVRDNLGGEGSKTAIFEPVSEASRREEWGAMIVARKFPKQVSLLAGYVNQVHVC